MKNNWYIDIPKNECKCNKCDKNESRKKSMENHPSSKKVQAPVVLEINKDTLSEDIGFFLGDNNFEVTTRGVLTEITGVKITRTSGPVLVVHPGDSLIMYRGRVVAMYGTH